MEKNVSGFFFLLRSRILNYPELMRETVLSLWIKQSWTRLWNHSELMSEPSTVQAWDHPGLTDLIHPAIRQENIQLSLAQAWSPPIILSSDMRSHWAQSWPSYHPELSHGIILCYVMTILLNWAVGHETILSSREKTFKVLCWNYPELKN